MNINFVLEDSKFSEGEETKWKELLSKVIKLYSDDIGLKPGFLNDVIISDEKKFEDAVKIHTEFRQFVYFDSNSTMVRSVLFLDEKESLKAALVIRREIIEQLLSVIKEEKEKWAYTELLNKSLIYHELGHCLDYQNRIITEEKTALDPDKFSVRQMYEYFSRILFDEFAASALVSKSITPGIFHENVNVACDNAVKRFNEIEGLKDNCAGKPEKLFELSVTAASGFWMILIRYAKLMGSKINNENVSKFRLKIWDKANPTTGALLSRMGKELWDLWQNYPKWENYDTKFLLEIWYLIAIENGFKFVETPEGDGVYWN